MYTDEPSQVTNEERLPPAHAEIQIKPSVLKLPVASNLTPKEPSGLSETMTALSHRPSSVIAVHSWPTADIPEIYSIAFTA